MTPTARLQALPRRSIPRPGNPGIAATVLQGTDGAHLVLSSSLTGAANAIQVTETDAGNGLAALTYGTGNAANYTQEAAPQDAAFSIAGVNYTSPSNTVADALNGVTLNLMAPTGAGSNATLSVSNDTSTIESNISAFVTAYNTMVTDDPAARQLRCEHQHRRTDARQCAAVGHHNQIQQALYSVVNTGSSTYNSLASIGITTNSDGS